MHKLLELLILVTPYFVGTIPSYFCPMNNADYVKPIIQPPGWVFGVMWTALYFLMGIFLIVNIREGLSKGFDILLKSILLAFTVSLIINSIWVPVFSCWKKKIMALYILAVYLLVTMMIIVMCLLSSNRSTRISSMCLVPLVWWLCCASQLSLQTITQNK
jgi:tryptophan-rich sensory protein